MQRDETQSKGWLPDPETLYQEIREVAHQIYEARQEQGVPGDEVTDWLDAEAQVRAKHGL
jgi:hypothetical protein